MSFANSAKILDLKTGNTENSLEKVARAAFGRPRDFFSSACPYFREAPPPYPGSLSLLSRGPPSLPWLPSLLSRVLTFASLLYYYYLLLLRQLRQRILLLLLLLLLLL